MQQLQRLFSAHVLVHVQAPVALLHKKQNLSEPELLIVKNMNWIPLNSSETLEQLINLSQQKPQVIFKHSTRCSISSMAKSRLEKSPAPEEASFYYLDLLSYRQLSNSVAELFGVEHESPQILMIKDGKCVYDESHTGINMNEIIEQL